MSGRDGFDFMANALGAFPVEENASDFLSILSSAEGKPNIRDQFLPAVILYFPHPCVTRNGLRVDIIGTVDEKSIEYQNNKRFFSITAEFYDINGRNSTRDQKSEDLVERLKDHQDPQMSPYRWVHPLHWINPIWFKPLVATGTTLSPNKRYLNRMGLVVHLTKRNNMFCDINSRIYQPSGICAVGEISMFDLVYEIRHWDVFAEGDWTTERSPARNKNSSPASFDPTASNKTDLMRQFLTAMDQTTSLAQQLGIKIDFGMKTEGMGSSDI